MSSPKISVLTITYKPGYIDTMVQALTQQTLPPDEWEWILVDDLCDLRRDLVREHVDGRINYRHLPSREIKEHSATATAVNTGLAEATGQLVYFMADYCYPLPRVLERHWDLYDRYGPNILISGPLVDGITIWGACVFQGVQAWCTLVKVGEDVQIFNDLTPPIPVGFTSNFWVPQPDNLLSILERPFIPPTPQQQLGVDWRLGMALGQCEAALEPRAFRYWGEYNWWWAGRNDSAPLALLRQVGGLDESEEWKHGGLELVMAKRMKQAGASYIFDLQAACCMLMHPFRKSEKPPAPPELC